MLFDFDVQCLIFERAWKKRMKGASGGESSAVAAAFWSIWQLREALRCQMGIHLRARHCISSQTWFLGVGWLCKITKDLHRRSRRGYLMYVNHPLLGLIRRQEYQVHFLTRCLLYRLCLYQQHVP